MEIDVKTAQTIVANIDAFLAGDTAPGIAEYKIGDKEIRYIDKLELLKLRGFYVALIDQAETVEKMAAGLGNPRKIKTRFTQ